MRKLFAEQTLSGGAFAIVAERNPGLTAASAMSGSLIAKTVTEVRPRPDQDVKSVSIGSVPCAFAI